MDLLVNYLMLVDDLVLRICESEFCHTYRRIRVVRSKAATSGDIVRAQKALYLSLKVHQIAFALDIAHQLLELK